MIRELLSKCTRFFWFVPGLILWESYPPLATKTDCLFALAPLLFFSRCRPAGRCFRLWFVNGLVFWAATLSWMPAIVKNEGPWPLVLLGWGALSAYCALYFGAFGWLSSKVWSWAKDEGSAWRARPQHPYARRAFAILVAEPVLWCGLELVRSRLFGGFAWNHLGLPLVNANLGSPAALGGVYLLSAVVVLVNGTIAGIVERVLKRLPRWMVFETFVPLLLVWGLYALGGKAVRDAAPVPDGRNERRVLMVQRNFPCVFKIAERPDPVAVYTSLLANLRGTQSDLVVLPESALSEFGAVGSPRARAFMQWVAEATGVREVLAGGGRFAGGKEYNSAVLCRAEEESIYDKVHLVPFGEFIPFDKWIPALQRLAPVGSCTPGELKLLGDYGVAICYEDTDSAQMRALARMGARCLVFITNDSWFSQSVEAEQHAWQSTARAIETGLSVIRVGNSGVTGTISSSGRANWLAGADARPLVDASGAMCDSVLLRNETPRDGLGKSPLPVAPLYTRVGDIPLASIFVLLIGLMVLVKYKDDYEKRRYLSM